MTWGITRKDMNKNGSNEMSTRDQILGKSRELFHEKSFSDVSINDIVTALSITKPTLYYYFGSKENLYTETVLDIMRLAHQQLAGNVKVTNSLERNLTAIAQTYFQSEPPGLCRLLCEAEHHLSQPNVKKIQEAYQYLVLSPIKDMFTEAIKSREIADYEPMKLATLYMILLEVFNSKPCMLGTMEPLEKTKLLTHLMFYGLYTR